MLSGTDANVLQNAHAQMIEAALTTLRELGFQAPFDRLGNLDEITFLCELADAASAFAASIQPNLRAECAAHMLVAFGVFYRALPAARALPYDGDAFARLLMAASILGVADGMRINANLGIIDRAAEKDIRDDMAREAGRQGAEIRHAPKRSKRALEAERARNDFERAKAANAQLTPSGWAKRYAGDARYGGRKWRALSELLRSPSKDCS